MFGPVARIGLVARVVTCGGSWVTHRAKRRPRPKKPSLGPSAENSPKSQMLCLKVHFVNVFLIFPMQNDSKFGCLFATWWVLDPNAQD